MCDASMMEYATDETKADRLYLKALAIRYERALGLWLPIMWHLALRGHPGAMVELADWFSRDNRANNYGHRSDSFSAAALYWRAYRKGHPHAASNAAISHFNFNDMIGYRNWLRRAAQGGDAEAALRLRRFETRRWHHAAFKIGRGRPYTKRDEASWLNGG